MEEIIHVHRESWNHLGARTCAALLDVDVAEVRLRIDDLVRANLLEEAGDDRYRMHDLLRAYADEQADRDESDRAMRRLFDHYPVPAPSRWT